LAATKFYVYICWLAAAETISSRDSEGRVRGLSELTLLKFGAEVKNCIWRLCRTGVKVMAMTHLSD